MSMSVDSWIAAIRQFLVENECPAHIATGVFQLLDGLHKAEDGLDRVRQTESILFKDLESTMNDLAEAALDGGAYGNFTPNFVAMDADGRVHMYDCCPYVSGNEWKCPPNGTFEELGFGYTVRTPRLRNLWKHSLAIIHWDAVEVPESDEL